MKSKFFALTIFPAMFIASSTTNYINVNSSTGNNNINGNSTSTSKSYTHITTETNGDVTEIESHDSGSISVKSENGKTTVQTSPGMKVDVKRGEAKVEDNLSKPSVLATSAAKFASPTAQRADIVKKIKKQRFETLSRIKKILDELLRFFHL